MPLRCESTKLKAIAVLPAMPETPVNAMDQTELEFLNDMNALISQTLEENGDPLVTLKVLANEVRNRISDLEENE